MNMSTAPLTPDMNTLELGARPFALARRYGIYAVLIAAALVYLAVLPAFQVGTYYDDALYITLAKSLSSGAGFRRVELLGAPETTFVPFGYPLLLAPLVSLFPGNFVPLQVLSLAFSLGAIIVSWVYAKQRFGLVIAAASTALFALNPTFVSHATLVMSEPAFTFFSLLTLLLAELYISRRPALDRTWVALVGAASMTAFIRLPGLVCVGAILVYLVLTRRLRHAAALAVPFAALQGAWYLRNWFVAGSLLSREYVEIGARAGASNFLNQLNQALVGFFWLVPNTVLPVLSPRIAERLEQLNPLIPLVIALAIWLPIIIGYLFVLRSRLGTAEIYVALMAPLLVAWGFPQGRYLVPLLPLLCIYLCLGLYELFKRVVRRTRPLRAEDLLVGCATGILLLSLARDAQSMVNPLRERIPDISLGATWIRDHSLSDALVMTATPRSTFVYSERVSVPFPIPTASAEDVDVRYVYGTLPSMELEALLRWAINKYGVDYILVAPPIATYETALSAHLDEYASKTALPVLKADPSRFSLVYSNPQRQVFVFQVN